MQGFPRGFLDSFLTTTTKQQLRFLRSSNASPLPLLPSLYNPQLPEKGSGLILLLHEPWQQGWVSIVEMSKVHRTFVSFLYLGVDLFGRHHPVSLRLASIYRFALSFDMPWIKVCWRRWSHTPLLRLPPGFCHGFSWGLHKRCHNFSSL